MKFICAYRVEQFITLPCRLCIYTAMQYSLGYCYTGDGQPFYALTFSVNPLSYSQE